MGQRSPCLPPPTTHELVVVVCWFLYSSLFLCVCACVHACVHACVLCTYMCASADECMFAIFVFVCVHACVDMFMLFYPCSLCLIWHCVSPTAGCGGTGSTDISGLHLWLCLRVCPCTVFQQVVCSMVIGMPTASTYCTANLYMIRYNLAIFSLLNSSFAHCLGYRWAIVVCIRVIYCMCHFLYCASHFLY